MNNRKTKLFQSSLFPIVCLPFLSILFLNTNILFAQKNTSEKNKIDKTVSMWNFTVHDFKTIYQNEPARYNFEFVNNSSIPLLVSDAKASCSCTKVAFTPNPVLPGLKGTVSVTYLAHSAGKFSKSVTVIMNTGEKVVLRVTGEVIQKK